MLKLNVQAAAATVITMNKEKVLLGMSGGVDSSVAAFLLKEQGYDVLGVTLKLTEDDNGENTYDAKCVADHLEIPHIEVDLRYEFKKYVSDYFVSEYKNGRTPNPCVMCNKKIKFGEMLKIADDNNCKYLATGHYAKIEKDANGTFYLCKAKSREKDQTYFLYNLTQDILSRTLFPLGDFEKTQIREIAARAGLGVSQRRDSQDICFIPDGDKNAYLKRFLKEQEGNFVDTDGNILGKHKGIFHYTVGQRKGLGMAFGKPMFVLSINPKDNAIVLGVSGTEMSGEFSVTDVNFIYNTNIPMECTCKVRYSAKDAPCVIKNEDGKIKVLLKEDARAITPGQAAVFYDGEKTIGGGIIF